MMNVCGSSAEVFYRALSSRFVNKKVLPRLQTYLSTLLLTFLLSCSAQAEEGLLIAIDFEDAPLGNNGCMPQYFELSQTGVTIPYRGGTFPICKMRLPGVFPVAEHSAGSGNVSVRYGNYGQVFFNSFRAGVPTPISGARRMSFEVTHLKYTPSTMGPIFRSFGDLTVSGAFLDTQLILSANHTRVSVIVSPGRSLSDVTIQSTEPNVQGTIVVDNLEFYGSEEPSEPTVSLANLKVTQVVPNFRFADSPTDVDLVLGKSTILEYDAILKDGTVNSTTPVVIEVTSSDGTVKSSHRTTVGELHSSLSAAGTAHTKSYIELPFIPKTAGPLTFTLSAAVGEKVAQITRSARVKKTNGFGITYQAVAGEFDCPHNNAERFCNGPLSDSESMEQFSSQATKYITAVMPTADDGVKAAISPTSFVSPSGTDLRGIPLGNWIGLLMTAKDALALDRIRVLSNTSDEVSVGVVPSLYFAFKQLDITGVSWPVGGIKSVLVAEQFWTTAAHELGHVFGAEHESQQTEGYWIAANKRISKAKNLMASENTGISGTLDNIWVSPAFYGSIFKNRLVDPVDPKLFIVSGIIFKDGKTELAPLGYLPEGFQTGFDRNLNGAVNLLDTDGRKISSSSFSASFKAITSGAGEIDTDFSPFLVKLPADDRGVTIEIAVDGNVVQRIEPHTTLISDTIKAIAANQFKNMSEIRRSTLLILARKLEDVHRKCTAFPKADYRNEALEEQRDQICAVLQVNLASTLREHVESNLRNSVAHVGALELSAPKALRNIDAAVLRLIPDRKIFLKAGEGRTIVLPVQPGSPSDREYSVAVSNLPASGSVSVSANGVIVYTSGGDPRASDSFRVRISSKSGESIIRTISVVPHE